MNSNNFAQKTNYTAGSDKLALTSLYLQSVNLPGVTLSHPEVSGRSGTKLHVQSDNVQFNNLTFTLLVDEQFLIYHEFVDKVFTSVSPTSGSFANIEFDFWVQVNNSKGHKLFVTNYTNCRVTSVSDVELDSASDETEFTMTVDVVYDYFTVNRGENIPVLAV